MQQVQSDSSLEIKKRARRRLVGAIALVLLMIIILPMLLEDRDINGTNESVEIIMPGQDETTASLGLDEQLESVVPMAEKSAEVTAEPVDIAEVKIDSAQAKQAPAAPSQSTKETQKAETKVAQKPVSQPTAPKSTETKSTKPAASATGQYYVQIGVFSNPSNITKLQAKLDDLGYDSFTEKMTKNGSVKTRLRTKSFDGRNEAAIALENIKDAGLTGMVVSEK